MMTGDTIDARTQRPAPARSGQGRRRPARGRRAAVALIGALSAAGALLAAGALSATGTLPDQSVVEWIRANAIPLATVEAGHGFADLQPLKGLIGDARIVSLGEATHGSREIFQLKHRMVEFLATEMGFTIFAIEANMPEAYRVNDYVLNGTGDPAELLRGLYFWTWDTEEVLAMIRWMCEFNRSGRGRIEFAGFDMQTPTVALEIVRRFVADRDPGYAATFDAAARLADASRQAGNAFAFATGNFPVADAAGKTIRFSGYIKTESVANGWAGLWWRVDGAKGQAPLAFDNMRDRGGTGTSDWRRYVIELAVDPQATNINFGLLMPGSGTAWFDDLAIDVDGRPCAAADLFDLAFESPTPRGFRTGGSGYEVRLDGGVAHGGTQSLRMARAESPSDATASDPALPASRWQGVLEHLEGARATYRAGGADDRAIDWAIQNARIVLQGMQMRSDTVSRDRSMADNIKWIADRNPGARIVLWAHNGHVAKRDPDYETMGRALRKMFGRKMLVLGSVFDAGSFQAVPSFGKPLESFTVPPAPEGSLDATLAAASIPVFAIDLRHAPAWFDNPHKSRRIGAKYPEDRPYAHLEDLVASEAFDAILFIRETTAARRNPGR